MMYTKSKKRKPNKEIATKASFPLKESLSSQLALCKTIFLVSQITLAVTYFLKDHSTITSLVKNWKAQACPILRKNDATR